MEYLNKMKKIPISFSIFFLCLLTGCAGAPKFTVGPDTPGPKRQLVVYRDSSMVGAARTIGLSLNGEEFELKPGSDKAFIPKIGRNILARKYTSCCSEGATRDPAGGSINIDVAEEGLIKIGVGVKGEFIFERLNLRGEFVSNQPILAVDPIVDRNGETQMTFADGVKYSGALKDGKMSGQGVLIFPNGNKYEGEFKDGKLNGKGVFTWANGDKYEGMFVDGSRDGKGVLIGSNGYKYDGSWKAGNREGTGSMVGLDGLKYDGEWKNNKYDGHGVMSLPDGGRSEGQWKDGLRNGRGVFIWANGDKYEGEWLDGKQNGFGTITYKNGIYKTGTWVNGNITQITNTNIKTDPEASSQPTVSRVSSDQAPVTINGAKDKCKDLGFKLGTDDFGKCVLQLTR